MRQRVITAIIALALLLVVVFVIPAGAAKAVIALLVLGGAWEWSAFVGAPRVAIRFLYVVLVAAMIGFVSLALGGQTMLVLGVAVVWWLAALIWTFFFPTPIPTVAAWISGLLVLVPLHAALINLYDIAPTILLFMLLIVWVADSGAYFAGKKLGRVKLAPRISPGKTWEGVIGGLAAVVLLTLGRAFFVDTNLAVFVPFCVAVACLSIVGDLTVSMVKRNAGVKDSGNFFPGHGGILDRVDSVSAAAPLFALGVNYLGLR
jgi:phosphatidate cytidylyltransferase